MKCRGKQHKAGTTSFQQEQENLHDTLHTHASVNNGVALEQLFFFILLAG